MAREFVLGLDAPKVDMSLVYEDAKNVVKKTYEEELLDYSFQCFFESFMTYRDDMDSSKYQFKVTLANKIYLVQFDVESLYHLFGLSKESLRVAVSINEVLKLKYGTCPKSIGFCYSKKYRENNPGKVHPFEGIKMFEKLCKIFIENDSDIKSFDCNPLMENIDKLNWDKVAYKLYCFLNIGDLSCGDTIFYSNRDELLFERKLITETGECDNVLLIRFVPEREGSIIYNPRSIVIVPKASRYELGANQHKKSYTRVKGLKRGFATIEKREVK